MCKVLNNNVDMNKMNKNIQNYFANFRNSSTFAFDFQDRKYQMVVLVQLVEQ